MLRFLTLFCFLFIVIPTTSAENALCNSHQCITVIDAGSTGSRVHIYAYDMDETNTPTNISEVWTKKIKPGFATIEPNYNTIDAYLSILLAGAPTQQGPVYFYATAGMRLLPSSKQKLYYQELRHWFAQQHHWHLVDAKTITGNEEALYDWLSVNYHLGTLKSAQNKSIGVMDMGGASVQIVFPIPKGEQINGRSQVELDLYGQHINLFVYSFLGLGQTEMSHQFLNSSACFSNDYPLPDGEIGQGNALSCAQEVSTLMNSVHGVNKTIQPLLAANPVDSWYAIGGLTNLADNKLFNFVNGQLTNQSLIEQADNQICRQTWSKLDAQYPNDEYIFGYCLFSAYFYALMVDGYGIYPEQTVNYISPSINLDWTKGVVLHHVI